VDKSIPTRGGENIPADVYLMDRAAVIQCNIRDIKARKQSEGAIHDLARFPTENPNPVMRIDRGGNLVYANEAALVQVADWKLELGKPAPRVLNDVIREVLQQEQRKRLKPLAESAYSRFHSPYAYAKGCQRLWNRHNRAQAGGRGADL